MNKETEILKLVSELIEEKQKNKLWTPGKDWVHYSGPTFDATEYIYAIETLLSEWLVLGKDAESFEQLFSKRLGKEYGILTNSGSSANLLMLAALKSKKLFNLPNGTKVITPIAGFPTTINPILQLGFVPVFVDIELDTLNLDLDLLEKTLQQNPDVKVITFAHVLGNPPDMNRVMELVEKYNLILLEDCCDAVDSKFDGKLLGSYGEMSSCSFYPAHHITMGEGGFVAMNNLKTERVVRSLREWGRACYCSGKDNILEHGVCNKRFNNWLPSLPNDYFDHKYVYSEIGYNLKPIELQASIGLAQLKKLDKFTEIRKENHKKLLNFFENYSEFFILPKKHIHSDPSWFAFALTIKDNTKFTRTDFCKFLESNKIQTRPYFAGNIMLQPAYEGIINNVDFVNSFPNATKVTKDTFFLGVSPRITSEQIDYIEQVVKKFFNIYNSNY